MLQPGASEPCQTTKMKILATKINGWKSLSIFEKRSHLDNKQGSNYASNAVVLNKLSNIYVETFCGSSWRLETVKYFCKKVLL